MTESQVPPLRRLHLWESPTLHGRPETDLPVHVLWEHDEFEYWQPTSDGGVIIGRIYEEERPDLTLQGEELATRVVHQAVASTRGTHLFKFWLEEYYPDTELDTELGNKLLEPITPPWQDDTLTQPIMSSEASERDATLHEQPHEDAEGDAQDRAWEENEAEALQELVTEGLAGLSGGPLPQRTPGLTEIPPVPIHHLPLPVSPPGVISSGRDSFLDTGSILIAPLAAPKGDHEPQLILPKTNGLINGIEPGDHEPVK